jgi:PKD repeat protein
MKKYVRLKYIIVLALLGITICSFSQTNNLTKAEYYIDSDPGFGKATNISIGAAADSLSLNLNISLAGYKPGMHTLYIRFRELSGIWSHSEARNFLVSVPDTATLKIENAEYFIDKDPGVGKGISINTGSATDSVSLFKAISLTSIPNGNHTLSVRFKYNNNTWSINQGQLFMISNSVTSSSGLKYAEYFIDKDPGLGLATPITGFVSGDSVKSQFAVDLTGLPVGSHGLTVRVRDSVGVWTMAENRFFNIVNPEPTTTLSKAEYFFDKDPGVGKGFELPALVNSDSVLFNATLDIKGLKSGSHPVFVRVRNSLGQYSLSNYKTFFICDNYPNAEFSSIYYSTDSTVNFTNLTSPVNDSTKYFWDINGDGKTDYNFATIVNKYKTPGIYNVRLIASNGGVCADTVIIKVAAIADTCSITSNFSFLAKLTREVAFLDQSTGNAGLYFWNFGDGKTSTAKNPVHLYDKAGYYVVSLAVKNPKNQCTDYSSKEVKVGETVCHANFTNITNDTAKTVTLTNTSVGNSLRYFWFFGDGNYSTEENPKHKFANEGAYNISLTISDPTGTCSEKYELPVAVGKVKCNATFSYYIDSTSNTAIFKDNITGFTSNVLWSFGDGTSSSIHNPQHKYARSGYFKVSLNTFNVDGWCMDYTEQTILVGKEGLDCNADFIYQASTTDNKVKFFDLSQGDIVGYLWNMGDETAVVSEKNPQHTYNFGGFFNVCLSVINNKNYSDIVCKPVIVADNSKRNCRADFNFIVDSITNKAYFVDVSDGKPNTWNWSFGNGITSTTQNGDLKYAKDGYYLVGLKIKNSETGCNSKTYKIVNIGGKKPIKAGFGFEALDIRTKSGGYPVEFVGAGVGDHARLRWTYGDGTVDSTSSTPVHVYNNIGTYRVCYELSNPITGMKDSVCQNVSTMNAVSLETADMGVKNLLSYPNPFNEYTTISYSLETQSKIELSVFNLNGIKLETIVNATKPAGVQTLTWNGSQLSKGIYIIQLKTSNGNVMNRIVMKK